MTVMTSRRNLVWHSESLPHNSPNSSKLHKFTGKETGDRHPKIGCGVLVGAQATILGNIKIGDGAQVAAGSLVLKPVEPHTMVAGNPAKVVGTVEGDPALTMQQWIKTVDPDGKKIEEDSAPQPAAAVTAATTKKEKGAKKEKVSAAGTKTAYKAKVNEDVDFVI